MRAALRSAAKQKRSIWFHNNFLRSPSLTAGCNRPTISYIIPFCTSALEESNEDSDADGDMVGLDQEVMARFDTQVLFSRLNTGLNSGSINSADILDIMKKLSAAGAIIPVSFMLDAGQQSEYQIRYHLHSAQSSAVVLFIRRLH